MSDTPLKIFVISDFDDQNANVIRDFLLCFNKHSRHVYYYSFDPKAISKDTDLSTFDVVLLFWSIYLPGGALSNAARENIRESKALKVLFLQDEYRDVRLFNKLIAEIGVQVMFTCVAESDHNLFYPSEIIPSLQATYSVLTGYVPTYLEAYQPSDEWNRPIDIGYRSRELPYYLGDLAREKTTIAHNFQDLSSRYGFRSDISVRESDRIYGEKWIDFLKASRFTLGTPSGVSVIDFTGEIRYKCENYLALHPSATYEEVKQSFFADVDGTHVIDTISPRVFEAAALGCAMVMHEGYYSGILEAGKHYISIKKDYSNIEDVVAQMKDEAHVQGIIENTYQDIIASGNYSYRTFVRWFDTILEKHVDSIGSYKSNSKISFYAKNYFKFGQIILPKGDEIISLPGRKIFGYTKKMKMLGRYINTFLLFPNTWRILFAFFRKSLWKHIPLKYLTMDLYRLGVISSILANKNNLLVDFHVSLSYNPVWQLLSLMSYNLLEQGNRVLDSEDKIIIDEQFDLNKFVFSMKKGNALFEWDHSLVSSHLEYTSGKNTYSTDMGLDGRYQFSAITKIAQFFPDLIQDFLKAYIFEYLR